MRQTILFSLITVILCQACSAQQSLNTPTTSPGNIAIEETANMPTPSMIIDPMKQRGKIVTVLVGDVFAVSLPQGSSRWKVDYAGSVFQLLTLAENMEEPGPQGWLFRAIAVGQTDIRLTAPAAECNQPQPCPPAPPISYVFTVDVK